MEKGQKAKKKDTEEESNKIGTLSKLPSDIIIDILSRIPVKSLFDCRWNLSQEVLQVLEEFGGIMPQELVAKCPPRRAVDPKIELEPGTKPLALAGFSRWPLRREIRKAERMIHEMGFGSCVLRPCLVHVELVGI
ncbi:hypothetical protein HHK36_032256 [Tetracentron sinense]|uniref:F-box domain-containing protein n=1 Tax=Tetracentron sinense TaxID=13715 RepID=A0A835CXU3_TETSI|nr:hypothetical protein HHK36_032256 [Tetracentron sinense]